MWDSIEKYLEEHYQNVSLEFRIYEDGSTDDTRHQLELFIKNRRGKLLEIKKPIQTSVVRDGISHERGAWMANLRANVKQYHYVWMICQNYQHTPTHYKN